MVPGKRIKPPTYVPLPRPSELLERERDPESGLERPGISFQCDPQHPLDPSRLIVVVGAHSTWPYSNPTM